MATTNRKILRSPLVKRKSKIVPITERATLERVLGLTLQCNAALAVDSNTGLVAYPAGCVVVLYNPKKNKQSHILNSSKKSITSLAFSGDGKHLVTGECGHQPCVRVWEVEERVQVAEFKGHKFGINCVAFSPNLKYIVSIGTQHDMIVNVWNWRTNAKVASNKIACKVNAVAFSDDGSMFVTVGSRHVKFWYMEASKSKIKTETLPLLGRSGILGERKNNHFCDVACGKGEMSESTYVITQSGLLCEFNAKRLLDKWVELRTDKASSITVGEEYIFIGCSDGITRVFDAYSLHFVTTMPRPHYLGADISAGLHPSDMIPPNDNAQIPDTIAVAFDDENKKVICVYNDHSLYVWDVRDIRKIGKAASFLYHSSSIWGLDVYPVVEEHKPALPAGSFITCAGDDTIRIWNLDSHMNSDTLFRRNIYSNELLKIIYADPNMTNLCDQLYTPAGGAEVTDTSDGKNGVRCVQVSPDGQHLASGDRMGNVRVHELHFCGQVCQIEAHNSEVLSVQYSKPNKGKDIPRLLATASRDRLLHIFDVEQDYGLLQTLDDHSSSITSVRFTESDDQFQMLSCGADKSLLFRTAQLNQEFQFVLNHHLVGKTTLFDMDVDPTNKFVATACQDRNIRVYNARTAKMKKIYKGSQSDDGSLLKIQIDPSGSYIATSASDKSVNVYDFYTGECMATAYGHSEVVTGLKFTNDLKHLISISGDGCIFVWRLSLDLTEHMRERVEDLGHIPTQVTAAQEMRRETYVAVPAKVSSPRRKSKSSADETDFPVHNSTIPNPVIESKESTPPLPSEVPPTPAGYKFSIGQLPAWAKKQIAGPTSDDKQAADANNLPRGRWAQRMDSIKVMSMLDESSIHLSVTSSPEKRRYSVEQPEDVLAFRRDTMVISDSTVKLSNVPIIEDADRIVDDDDDDDEFVPLSSSREFLDQNVDHDVTPMKHGGGVTTARGSGPRTSSPRHVAVLRTPSYEEDVDELSKVIYYPSDEELDSDENTNTFQVYENPVDKNKPKPSSRKLSDASIKDHDSVSTGVTSEEDEEIESVPGTPLEPEKGFLDSPDKENFLKNNFENLGASPDLVNETFNNDLDTMEQQMTKEASNLPSHRLSLSSRFLSRAQTSRLRTVAAYNNATQNRKSAEIHRSVSPGGEVQKRKDEMAKAVDDTRRRLQALGWKSDNRGEENIPVKDVLSKSPPSKLESKDDFPIKSHTKTNTLRQSTDNGRSSTPGGMRRCWSMVDVSKTPVSRYDKFESSRRSLGGSNITTPSFVSRVEVKLSPAINTTVGSHRSKSVQNLSNIDTENQQPGTQSKKAGQYRRPKSYEKQTTSSSAKLLKSSSSTALNRTPSDGNDKATSRKRFQKGRLSSSHRSQWQSSPNLVTHMEEEAESDLSSIVNETYTKSRGEDGSDNRPSKSSAPLLKVKTHRSRSNSPNIRRIDNQTVGGLRKARSREDLCSSSDSLASIPSIACDSPRSSEERDHTPPKVVDQIVISREENDKIYMPPPASITVKKASEQHKTFLQRATHPKRKSNDLTLSQAKDILMGKSSLLQNEKEDIVVPGQEATFSVSTPINKTKQFTNEKVIVIEDLDELPVKECSPIKGLSKTSSKELDNIANLSLQTGTANPLLDTVAVAGKHISDKPVTSEILISAIRTHDTEPKKDITSPRSVHTSRGEMKQNQIRQPTSQVIVGEKETKSRRSDGRKTKNVELEDAKKKGLDTGLKLQELLNMANMMSESFSPSPPDSTRSSVSSRESSPRKDVTPQPETIAVSTGPQEGPVSASIIETTEDKATNDTAVNETIVKKELSVFRKTTSKHSNEPDLATKKTVTELPLTQKVPPFKNIGSANGTVLSDSKVKDTIGTVLSDSKVKDGKIVPVNVTTAHDSNARGKSIVPVTWSSDSRTRTSRVLPNTSDRKSALSIKDLVQKPDQYTKKSNPEVAKVLSTVIPESNQTCAITAGVDQHDGIVIPSKHSQALGVDKVLENVATKGKLEVAKEASKKPDRSQLKLDLTPETPKVIVNSTPEECQEAVDSLKSAVDNISQVFTKLTDTHENGTETTSMQMLVKESLADAIKSLKKLQNGGSGDQMAVVPENLPWMEPFLQQYSTQLTDRIYKLVQNKLDNK